MTDQHDQLGHQEHQETTDRGCGLFNFMGKKEEKAHGDAAMIDIDDTANVVEQKQKKEENHTLMEELHRTHSHSSSSSDDEEEEGGSRKTKKKGLKEKIKAQISGDNKEEGTEQKDECIPMEKCNAEGNAEATHVEEKKGFMDKIKEKLPQHKKSEEGHHTTHCADEQVPTGETKEKKGILDKIKEKLPGHHKNNDDDYEKQKSN